MQLQGNSARRPAAAMVAVMLILAFILALCPVTAAGAAEPNEAGPAGGGPLLEIFDEALAPQASWQAKSIEGLVHDSRGYSGPKWGYYRTRDGKVSITGLSLDIRENPGPGQYRYLSFAWRKWGGGQTALEITRDPSKDGQRQRGELYDYRYDAGEGPPVEGKALRLAETVSDNWTEVTRDLWEDFGDFTITGLSFESLKGRDAGFDRIYVARTKDDLQKMPPTYREAEIAEQFNESVQTSPAPILPAQVAQPVDENEIEAAMTANGTTAPRGPAPVILHSDVETQKVSIDWWSQVMAGGFTMIPLLALSIAGVVIGIQRMLTIRVGRMAPPDLEPAVRQAMSKGDVKSALDECERHPSTLADALRFIIEHRHNDVQVVNQAAGDIAARDIRDRLSGIYPLSVIGSLAPLLGLLGTIIGMIEAFALVSIYGDEGGATLLSGSISKALITTAAGLIIAIPAVAVYYVIRNRLMRISSQIEIAMERLITSIYLKKDQAD